MNKAHDFIIDYHTILKEITKEIHACMSDYINFHPAKIRAQGEDPEKRGDRGHSASCKERYKILYQRGKGIIYFYNYVMRSDPTNNLNAFRIDCKFDVMKSLEKDASFEADDWWNDLDDEKSMEHFVIGGLKNE